MTDEVAALVLRNNYLQSLAISLTERKGTANGLELARFMSVLEGAKQLNRKVETLPDDPTLAERYAAGKPLTRPEIGVLLSYAKIVLFDALAASDLPDDPYFASTLSNYFPAKMQKPNASDIAGSPAEARNRRDRPCQRGNQSRRPRLCRQHDGCDSCLGA